MLALAARVAHTHGHIDHETMLRVVAMNGLMIAYYGNRAPKRIAPSACARRLSRVAGWSLVLSGLVYAGLWAFAPIPLAMTAGTGAVAAGVIVTLVYGLSLWARADA
ncbi:ammonium transporter [Reyranella sp. CPCC 100927]|nr:ammonium transporter [Reyranella sp. CPCC 100927]